MLLSASEITEIEDQTLSDSIISDSTTDCPFESSLLNVTVHEDQEAASNSFHMSLQTELTADMISSLDSELNELNSKPYQLRKENKKLKVGTEEWFQNNDSKTVFNIGLSKFTLLLTLFNFLVTGLKQSPNSVLSMFQEFALTLMRLRLNPKGTCFPPSLLREDFC